jgi:uncharacterized protein YjbI with pentapeptide repeats
MARKTGTAAPQIDAPQLEDLADSDGEELAAHGRFEGLRLTSVDLSGRALGDATFSECDFIEASAHETDFRSAAFLDTRFGRLNAPVFSAPRSRFRDVAIEDSRIGSAEFYDADWNSVHFSHCKLGYINLRGADLQDVLFTDCSIDELDLGGARATRVAFRDTRATALDVTQAALRDVDLRGLEVSSLTGIEGLRGATMTSYQIAELAPLFASLHGIRSED